MVANKTADPCSEEVIHNMLLLADHYKISLDKVYADHIGVKLLILSPDEEMTKVE